MVGATSPIGLALSMLPLLPLPLTAASTAATDCNLAGNWGGIGYAGSLFQIVQPAGSPNFTVFYPQAPQGLPGRVAGSSVEIPGWAGVVGTDHLLQPAEYRVPILYGFAITQGSCRPHDGSTQ